MRETSKCETPNMRETPKLPRMKTGLPVIPTVVALVVIALSSIVYGSQARSQVRETTKLPAHVAETREMILAAVRAASIEDLAPVIEASQAKTDFGFPPATDPIEELKKLSADGQGREILAALGLVLEVAPATLPLGKDLENNLIYVWPYLAERSLDQLTGPEEIDLFRLVPPAKIAEMQAQKRWLWWRLVIGADGSWLAFRKSQ